MKFKSSTIIALVREDCEDERIEYVDQTNWENEGKYSCKDYIFKFEGKFYRITISRSGSYYSDYYYCYEDWGDEIECPEVIKKERTIFEWVVVK